MARGPDERGRLRVDDRKDGPRKVKARANEHHDSLRIADGRDNGQVMRQGRSLPVAFASQAAPCEDRTQFGLMYRCPICSGTHFGRSPVQVTTGRRLARCGRMVWLAVARNYSGPDQGPAA
jgi:hypothetical protein